MSRLAKKRDESNISRVYFFDPCFPKGGGTAFFFRLAEYLLNYTKIKVGVIDYRDGIMAKTARKFYPHADITCVDYTALDWDLEENSCIFAPVERLGTIKNIPNRNVRILEYHWNMDTGYSLVFERGVQKKLATLLYKSKSTCFMSYGCYHSACQVFNKKFEKTYVPVFYPQEEGKIKERNDQRKNEINLVWLGRLASGSKTNSIINNFYQYKTDKRKKFHIIGNGLREDYIKNYIKQYQKNIQFIFTGALTGDDLIKYLTENADVGIAMGTSMLNFAALKIPVIGAHEARKENFHSRNFLWLFNMYEYSLSAPAEVWGKEDKRFEKVEAFDEMLNQVMMGNNRRIYGNKCYEYYKSVHGDIRSIGQKFVEALNRTTLTFGKLKKCFHFIPYGGAIGIAVHTYTFGLPLFKAVHHFNNVRYSFCGIQVARKVVNNGDSRWRVLGIEISQKWWGRYNFPHLVSPEIRKQCKILYSIDKCLPKEGGAHERS